jgi:hypothetical protein
VDPLLLGAVGLGALLLLTRRPPRQQQQTPPTAPPKSDVEKIAETVATAATLASAAAPAVAAAAPVVGAAAVPAGLVAAAAVEGALLSPFAHNLVVSAGGSAVDANAAAVSPWSTGSIVAGVETRQVAEDLGASQQAQVGVQVGTETAVNTAIGQAIPVAPVLSSLARIFPDAAESVAGFLDSINPFADRKVDPYANETPEQRAVRLAAEAMTPEEVAAVQTRASRVGF